jgi:hypothetical protein
VHSGLRPQVWTRTGLVRLEYDLNTKLLSRHIEAFYSSFHSLVHTFTPNPIPQPHAPGVF